MDHLKILVPVACQLDKKESLVCAAPAEKQSLLIVLKKTVQQKLSSNN